MKQGFEVNDVVNLSMQSNDVDVEKLVRCAYVHVCLPSMLVFGFLKMPKTDHQ
jgi:hypothetical protein